jgi:hypothetical protein
MQFKLRLVWKNIKNYFLKNLTWFEMQHYHVWIYLEEFKLYTIIALTQHQESTLNLLFEQLELLVNLIYVAWISHQQLKKIINFLPFIT